jgi:uncharacterized repeat protein (TIGR04052 family)
MIRKTIFTTLAVGLFVGCGGGGDSAQVSSTEVKLKEVVLDFEAMVGSDEASCGKSYKNLGETGVNGTFSDFRFYISDVNFIDKAGEKTALKMNDDGKWQYQNIALLDFENASGSCIDRGNTPETNSVVRGIIKDGNYVSVEFTLGVNQQYNHTNIDSIPAPLNSSSMNWSWQSGRKFTKIEFMPEYGVVKSDGTVASIWNFHLGSTGCVDNNCSEPNRLTYRIDNFDMDRDSIVFDFASLVNNIELTYDGGGAVGCMSAKVDPECTNIFESLSAKDGYCLNDCKNQTVIYAR